MHPPQQTKPHTAGSFSPFNMNDQIYFRNPRDHNQSEADCLPCTEWKLPAYSLQGIPPVKWKSPAAVSQTSHVLHVFPEDPGKSLIWAVLGRDKGECLQFDKPKLSLLLYGNLYQTSANKAATSG